MGRSRRSSSPHCATHATPISRTTSAMPIVGCANWGLRCSITSRLSCSIAATAAPTSTSVNSIWCSGNPPKPSSSLRRLEDICLIPCAETDDLKRAIAAYNTLAAR